MILALPKYDCSPLIAFSVCGHIHDKSVAIPDDPIRIETPIDASGTPIWVRLVIDEQGDSDGLHIHFDTARESSFSLDDHPQGIGSIETLDAGIKEYLGSSIHFFATSRFRIPAEDLSSDNVISLLSDVEIGDENHGVRLSGATFSVEPGPVEKISWKIRANNVREIAVRVHSQDETTLNELYLNDCYQPLERAFRTFVLGE